MMTNRKFVLPSILLLVACTIAAFAVWAKHDRSAVLSPPPKAGPTNPPLTEFVLDERSGHPFHSSDLFGHVWVASFFFAQCGANCRTMNMTISELQREFGPRGVRFVSISCDPQNDTPEALQEYAKLFQADDRQWVFLTGDFDYIRRIGRDMLDVFVDRKSHNTDVFVVDQTGQIRGRYNVIAPSELAKTTLLLHELLGEAENPWNNKE